jgi:hypothetical protein
MWWRMRFRFCRVDEARTAIQGVGRQGGPGGFEANDLKLELPEVSGWLLVSRVSGV